MSEETRQFYPAEREDTTKGESSRWLEERTGRRKQDVERGRRLPFAFFCRRTKRPEDKVDAGWRTGLRRPRSLAKLCGVKYRWIQEAAASVRRWLRYDGQDSVRALMGEDLGRLVQGAPVGREHLRLAPRRTLANRARAPGKRSCIATTNEPSWSADPVKSRET